MSDARNDLLLATMQRFKHSMDSDELLDQATQLALDNFWTPAHLTGFNRRGVAKRCRDLVDAGLAYEAGAVLDSSSRRSTPTYRAKAEIGPVAIPEPPNLPEPVAESAPTLSQVLAVIDAQADLLEEISRQAQRQLAEMIQSNSQISAMREKLRARLLATGLESL